MLAELFQGLTPLRVRGVRNLRLELARAESACANAEAAGIRFVAKAMPDERFERVLVVDDDRSVGGEKRGDDVAKVSRVRSEGDGGAVSGRLEHVLATARAEATADERDVRRAPPGAQFADRVD